MCDDVLTIFFLQHDYIFCHKVAQRNTNCRSAVSCGLRVTFEPEGHKVSDLCLVFGGVDANPAVAQKTCNSLIGQWVILSSISISKRLDLISCGSEQRIMKRVENHGIFLLFV